MSTVFSFLVLHMAQLRAACGEFGRLSEGDYLCDSCSGWIETMGTSFYLSGPSRKSGGHKDTYRKLWAFPPVTWHDPLSTHVVNVQPHAGDTGTDVSKSLTLPFRGNQVLGQDRYTDILFQPNVVRALMVWIHTRHVFVMLKIWRKCAHILRMKQQNTEI